MNYLKTINQYLVKSLSNEKESFIFGQNINTGTFISGLTKNINCIKNIKIHNTPNCEYSMIGLGFGFIISGGTAIYFAKQLDFLLLGCDHYVNTLNAIKNNSQFKGKFKVILFVCDQGFQGSQSSFNNIDDLSSMAQFDTFQINTRYEAEKVIPFFFKTTGFQILSISQRMSHEKIFTGKPISFSKNFSFLEYFAGSKQLIISLNFSFEHALKLKSKLESKNNQKVGLINSNYVTNADYDYLRKIIHKNNYKKIFFLNDGKSINQRFFKYKNELPENIKMQCIYRKKFDWKNQKDNFPEDLLNV